MRSVKKFKKKVLMSAKGKMGAPGSGKSDGCPCIWDNYCVCDPDSCAFDMAKGSGKLFTFTTLKGSKHKKGY